MTSNEAYGGSVLSVRDLRKSYGGKAAVAGISLEVRQGEIFALIGANGAGKTTAVECILGTRTRDSGEVSVLGLDPRRDRKSLFARVGVQFQETCFQDRITLKEACETASALYPRVRDWKPLLKTFGLEGKERVPVQTLSGGERQKLAVILALVPDPELLFLDELTTGLDPAARRGVWRFLKGLREGGTSIVLTSHFMDEVEYLCDRVAIMSAGRIVLEGNPAELTAAGGAKNLEELFLSCIDGQERADYENEREGETA